MQFTFPVLLLSLAFYICPAVAQPTHTMNTKFSELTSFLQAKMSQNSIVGSSLSIMKEGEIAYESQFGYANLTTKTPVDTNSIFHWASITKTFTGVAIMQLRDHGLLSLDDAVTDYIPELREVHNIYGSMDDITIRHLMTHSSGFRNPTWPWGGDKPWHPHEPQHWEQLAAMFPYTEIKFEPGTQWAYSNPGIIFLGRIIELITHDDYEYYIEKNILNPLGMNNSYFDRAPAHLLPNLVHSYYLQEDGQLESARYNLDTGITVSNGGLNAPVRDMMNYLQFLLGSADESTYKYVLKRSSINEMFEPLIKVAPDGSDAPENAGGQFMGLTFFVGNAHGLPLIGHSGNQNGFIAHIYLAPTIRTAYAIAYNTHGKTRALDEEILAYLVPLLNNGD
jgi:CubicO group peptidase (beta-lactamase class C family)